MQQLHVRNIFKLIVPFAAETPPKVDVSSSPSNFGFTVIFPATETYCSYRIHLFSDIQYGPGKSKSENNINSTELLQWGKKTATSFQTREPNNAIEAIILHLRIGPGFDFRKVPKRYVRFELECFTSGTFQYKGISKICQLLGKRRHASDSDLDEVSIPIVWNNVNAPSIPLSDLDDLHSLDEPDSSSAFHNNSSEGPSPNNNNSQLLGSDSEIVSTPNDLTQVLASSDSHFIFDDHIHNEDRALTTSNAIISFQQYSPEHDMVMARAPEQYMVLYNGNAEVVGNFRALNFYKASDINIKEDIRLLTAEHDPRDVLLKISGVSYKFKPGTTNSTQRRFVGYIAQQIESVVPEAVQLIDGILHVDYESLIPYLSESVKQNFNDIRNAQHETQKITNMVDQLFTEFTAIKERHEAPKSDLEAAETKLRPRTTWPKWLLGVSVITLLVASITIGAFVLYEGHKNSHIPLTPLDSGNSGLQPWTVLYALQVFYNSTNGQHWNNNTGWLLDEDYCKWYGITCEDGVVTKIKLSGNLLRGPFPGNFSLALQDSLSELDLSSNYLHGSLPDDIVALKRVQVLNFGDNTLFGSLPELTEISFPMLRKLDLSSNRISGSIPQLYMSLGTSLRYLNLSSNSLDGTIPNMERTPPTVVDLSWNYLEGFLPVVSAATGTSLDFSHNKLTGDYRSQSFTFVKKLNIRNNLLGGVFELSTMDHYEELDISNNRFTAFRFPLFVNHNSTDLPSLCKAAGNPFKCPLNTWVEEHCAATCTF